MPEVGIGFFPDVGTRYVLPRCPHSTGRYLALTGLRADCGDGVALGLATAYVPRAQLEGLIAAFDEEVDTIARERLVAVHRLHELLPVDRRSFDAGLLHGGGCIRVNRSADVPEMSFQT